MNRGGSIMSASRTARHVFALAAFAASVSSCASTHLAAVWRDPSNTPVRFSRTVVAFVTPDESLRRTVEDKLARNFPNATQSYRIVPTAAATDSMAIRQRLADMGYDGAVILRVADVQYQPNYVAGTYWYRSPYGFGNYWGSSWRYAYDPGYYADDKIVAVETQIYSLSNDRMIWAARSETTNPRSAGKLTDSVIKHVTKALRHDGLLAGLARRLDTWTSAADDE
jgi:hypothetical protein